MPTPIPHKEFDSNAFVGDKHISQDLCNFILSLSLAYNDYKFYILNYNQHIACKPDGKPARTSAWGEYNGVKLHLLRLHIGFAHELLKLIQENRILLNDAVFLEVLRLLNSKARHAWETLVEVVLTDASLPRRSNPLYMIRNESGDRISLPN